MMLALLNNDIPGFLKTASSVHLQIDKKKKVAPVRGLQTINLQNEKIANSRGRPNSLQLAVCPTKFQFPENPIPEWQRENRWESVLEAMKAAQTKFSRNLDVGRSAVRKQKKDTKICSYHGEKCAVILEKVKDKKKPESTLDKIEKVKLR